MRTAIKGLVLLPLLCGCYDLSRSAFPDAGPDGGGDDPSRVAWVRQAGGTGPDNLGALVGFGDGTFVAAGRFFQDAVFGPGEDQEQTLESEQPTTWNYFLAGFGPDGAARWARQISGIGYSNEVIGRGAGLAGGFALAGSFSGIGEYPDYRTTFGPGEEHETVLTSAGMWDVFVAVFGTDGDLAWARRAGGAKKDGANGVAAAGDGDLLVTGYFEEAAEFEGVALSQPDSCTAFIPSRSGLFVARWDGAGALEWARQAEGCASGNAVAALSDGGFLLAGAFAGETVFGPGETKQTALSSTGPGDMDTFLSRHGADGSLAWAVGAGGGSFDTPTALAARDDGSCVVAGVFEGTALFGKGEQGQTSLTSAGKWDVFVARHAGDGSLLWARSFGGPESELPNDVFLSADGAITLAGYFYDEITLDPGGAGETTLHAAGGTDAFVARFSADGSLLWARADGGGGSDFVVRMVPTGAGAAIVAGQFDGTTTIGAGDPGGATLTSFGGIDVFLARIEWD
jgi:hypothetical protein